MSQILCTHLNSPLLFVTRSGTQYLAEVSKTTMWTVLVVLPLLVLTRHSQSPVKPGWMFEMVNALMTNNKVKSGKKSWTDSSIYPRAKLNCYKAKSCFLFFYLILMRFWDRFDHESYLAMREQSCTMRLSMTMPWAASGFTMRPSWYHSTCMSSATKEAWHWNGKLSPWKTTCCWDGVSWKEGSSSGASAESRHQISGRRSGIHLSQTNICLHGLYSLQIDYTFNNSGHGAFLFQSWHLLRLGFWVHVCYLSFTSGHSSC